MPCLDQGAFAVRLMRFCVGQSLFLTNPSEGGSGVVFIIVIIIILLLFLLLIIIIVILFVFTYFKRLHPFSRGHCKFLP